MKSKRPKRTNNHLTESISWKLKKIRMASGLTQERVHEDTGVNLQRCESGKVNLSIVLIAILCDYYCIMLAEFFNGIETQQQTGECFIKKQQ